MKIAYLLAGNDLSGGARVIFQQAEELAGRGYGVTVVCPDPRPAWIPAGRARYEETPFERSTAVAESDAVVATFWTTVPPAVARARGAVFHLCQGYEADFGAYAPQRERILAAYALPTRKLVVTPHLRDRLARAGYGDADVVGQTFDAAFFAAPGRQWCEPPAILVPGIDVGEIKGVREALAALAELRARGETFRVLRVSSEPISGWERGFGVTDEYHRAVPPERMPFLYRRADLFVGPSHPEEGFDLPALEALAAGLPAALSDTPAHRHSAGDAALFFPARDESAITDAVERLMHDPAERLRLSELGPARAATFRTSDVGDRLDAIFRETASRRPSPGENRDA